MNNPDRIEWEDECLGADPHHTHKSPRIVRAMNNGFWDLPSDERASKMESACERGGVSNFFDLSPEERGAAYDRD